MLLAPVLWILTAVICYFFAAKIWWFPLPISAHGLEYDAQFHRTLLVTAVAFVLAQAALGYVIVKYRARGRRATYSHGNNTLEFIWTTVTAIVFVGAALMGTRIWAQVHLNGIPADAMPVEVLAKQFAWSFRYPGPDGKFGHTDLKLINDAAGNPFGLDDKDPASRDDIVSASLKVPVGRPIRLILHSHDVIHNFFVRELRLKQDIVPGMEIPFYFQADKEGIFEIPCSELCGLGHFQMRSTLQVMSPAEFDQWKQQQLAAKQ